MLSLNQVGHYWLSKKVKGNAMTAPKDDTRSAVGRQVSVAYLSTAREPLPRELKDLVVQLVAFEMHKRGSGAKPEEALQPVMAQPAPDPRCTDPLIRR
jgi:hypothetical protein